MRVLVVGSGAREHALCWRLQQCASVGEVVVAPGNPGMAPVARRVAVAAGDASGLLRVVRDESIDLVVIGPEVPLVAGSADRLRAGGATVLSARDRACHNHPSRSGRRAVPLPTR